MGFKGYDLEEIIRHYPPTDKLITTHNSLNLIGKNFNHLSVIYKSHSKSKRAGWVCRCDCGRYIFYTTDKLLSGEATTCGPTCPHKKQKTHLLAGKKFNRLTVLERGENKKDGHATWLCRCDCGNVTVVEGRYLESGRISSCGSCPDILKSVGNSYIHNWLVSHNIKFRPEVRFSDCRDKYPLPFDFVIYDYDNRILMCIEYQGNIHYVASGGWITEEHVNSVQRRDKIKKEYCDSAGIKLLCISYKDYNNLDYILTKNIIQKEN